MNDDGKVIGLLSQTDIVRFIIKHKDDFKDVLQKDLGQLSLGHGPVVSINGTL